MIIKRAENRQNLRNVFAPLFIILLCCLISYWPLTLGIFSLKNDIVAYFLPVRYQISEMIQSGQFPFWTPYINLGHPIYTDMQSGIWNPFVWLISLFGSYNMRLIQLELLFYIYLSGVSMFFLLEYFKLNRKVTLVLAISFMLCGFISDTAQTLYWVCGMAFFPFVFLFFLKTLRDTSFRSTLFFAFSLYLLFVTSYPGEFIIISYFLLSFLIFHTLKNKKDTLRIFKKLFLAVLIFCLFSLPAIISYLSGLNYITRGEGVSLDLALTNSMHPFNFISYLFPLIAWKLPIVETDILGRNSFIGLLPFILILIFFFTKTKNSFLVFLKWAFVLSVILSLGKYGLLRSLAYYILPYMDTFRHPSIFRFLTLFCGCILAAFILDKILKKPEEFILKKKIFALASILVIISSLLYLVFSPAGYSELIPASFTSDSFKTWLDNSTIKNWLSLELLLQIPFIILLYQYFIKKINSNIILIAAVFNSVFHVILIQPVTVVGKETVAAFDSKINSFKKAGFPLPELDKKMNSINETVNIDFSKYGPSNIYSKDLSYQFHYITPGPLISHETFMGKKDLHKTIFDYPVLYKVDTAIFYSAYSEFATDKKIVLTDDLSLLSYINSIKTDTLFTKKILSFNPGKWEFEITTLEKSFFCLVQNYYPKWNLAINGEKKPIYLCNAGLIGFKLLPGKNMVSLSFKDDKIIYGFYLQLALLVLFTIFILRMLFLYFFQKNKLA